MKLMLQGLKFWRFIHIWSGRIIVLFFLMWFISGLVLIYHPYPKLTDEEIYSHMPLYDAARDSIHNNLSPLNVAENWLTYPVSRIDTLTRRSQWVLFPKYEGDLPIFKFFFDDPDKTQLFISGTTLKPIQQTTRATRWWSYVGAIPHKFYLPALRRAQETWKVVVTIGGILCFIAALSGMIEGIGLLRRRYKKTGRIGNPYKKWPMRLHFGFGIFAGVVLITWGISGIFAMNKVPEWIAPTENELNITQSKFWGKKMPADSLWRLSPLTLSEKYSDFKSYETVHFGRFPAVKVVIGDKALYFNGLSAVPEIMEIPEDVISERIRAVCGDSLTFTLRKLDHYTQYYMPRLRGQANLPVYEAKINDRVHSTIYIDPNDGYIRYITDHKRIRKWLFEGFHYWDFKGLFDRPVLWTIVIWTLCLSCIVVCLTGIIVTVRRILR